MRLIGINGFKTSGKDTVYRIVEQHMHAVDLYTQRAAFADKLKIMAAKALGFEREDHELIELMDSFKETGYINIRYDEPECGRIKAGMLHDLTGREYLQWFGAHARQVFGDTFWIDQILPKPGGPTDNDYALSDRYPGVDVLCITDCRYPNEAARVKNLGGEVWEIIRPGLASDGHSSEQPLPHELVDVVINNNGTINDLASAVAHVLKHPQQSVAAKGMPGADAS